MFPRRRVDKPQTPDDNDRDSSMRITFCWSHTSGYMAACWRALAAREGIDLSILAWRSAGQEAFGQDVMQGLNVRYLSESEQNDVQLISSLVTEGQPDVVPDIVVVGGWHTPAYRGLTTNPALRGAKFVMTMDTPWRGTLRQRLGRYRMGSYFRTLDRVVVAGERAWQLAVALGIPEFKLRRGMYGFDYQTFAPIWEARCQLADGWPRRFLYTGRYVPEKGIDVLIQAYRRYRSAVPDPWPLTCCGIGPMKSSLAGIEGIEDAGFVQPADLPGVMLRHGAFVLASRYEPWGVVVAEASAAGLPVLCTEACGAAVELVRSQYNGLTVTTDHVDALLGGLVWMHQHHEQLPEMGRRSQVFAEAHSAQQWADRHVRLFAELMGSA